MESEPEYYERIVRHIAERGVAIVPPQRRQREGKVYNVVERLREEKYSVEHFTKWETTDKDPDFVEFERYIIKPLSPTA